MSLFNLYGQLLSEFGKQGWWPLQQHANKKGFNSRGYRPSNYNFPVSESEKLEVCIGAILTQYFTFSLFLGVFRYFYLYGLADKS